MSEWRAGDVPPSMTEELEMTCECPDEDCDLHGLYWSDPVWFASEVRGY